MKNEYGNIKKVYLVEESDLKKQNDLLESIMNRLDVIEAKINPTTEHGSDILSSKDIKKDLGIGDKSLQRRLYEWENPLPMVLEGKRLKIRRDKYEAWKRSIGL